MSNPQPEANATLAARLQARFAELVPVASTTDELTYEVPLAKLRDVMQAVRDEFGFDQLMDVCALDYLAYGQPEWQTQEATNTGFSRGVTREPWKITEKMPRRFAVVYHLLSVANNERLRLRAFCADDQDPPVVPSVNDIWNSANWFEREAFDLYGVLFDGHPDLRRILTDYGFIGHAFRKDFPLSGNVEVRYDPEQGRVIYQPVTIEPRTLVPKVIRKDHQFVPGFKEGAGDA